MKTIRDPIAVSDPTIFYRAPFPGASISKRGDPNAEIENKLYGDGSLTFDFSHSGKDPLTPGFVTPALDVHAFLEVSEDLEKGTLSISGNFRGDIFPSTEAFVVDQSGENKVFFGAKKEDGGIHSLLGDNNSPLFRVDIKIKFDEKGNFTGVSRYGIDYSVDDWNKKVQNGFDED